MARDWLAEYGYRPTWDLQREKQEEAAANRDARLHGELTTLEELEKEDD